MLLKRAHEKKPEINVVPMVDIVFQLIIFFLVATQVKKSETADVTLPTARRSEEIDKDEKPPLIVNIVKPERSKVKPYIVMGNVYGLKEFKRFLKQRRLFYEQKGEKMPVLRIRGDRDSQFKEIQDALIACRDIGIWQVRLSTLKKNE